MPLTSFSEIAHSDQVLPALQSSPACRSGGGAPHGDTALYQRRRRSQRSLCTAKLRRATVTLVAETKRTLLRHQGTNVVFLVGPYAAHLRLDRFTTTESRLISPRWPTLGQVQSENRRAPILLA